MFRAFLKPWNVVIKETNFWLTDSTRFLNLSSSEMYFASTCIRNVFLKLTQSPAVPLNVVIFNFGNFVVLETAAFSISNFFSATSIIQLHVSLPQLTLMFLLFFTCRSAAHLPTVAPTSNLLIVA